MINFKSKPPDHVVIGGIRGKYFVRMKGLEPPSLAALDPKSSASTNFATSALFIPK